MIYKDAPFFKQLENINHYDGSMCFLSNKSTPLPPPLKNELVTMVF